MKRASRLFAWAIVAGAVSLAVAAPTSAATLDVTVVNASSREVTGLYLAATAQSGWGADQLNGDYLEPNGTVSLAGVGCAHPSLVIVAEDVAGCFLYQPVACGGAATWTITNATTRDCGR